MIRRHIREEPKLDVSEFRFDDCRCFRHFFDLLRSEVFVDCLGVDKMSKTNNSEQIRKPALSNFIDPPQQKLC